jgi:putative membrane protein insertion efficiency factor
MRRARTRMGHAPGGEGASVLNLLLRGLIRLYQLLVSPLLPPRCRYLPSCSDYALEALASHGVLHGLFLALRRIGRCHPWGGSGYDPVPPVPHQPSGPAAPRLHRHDCGAAHPRSGMMAREKGNTAYS